MRRPRKILTTTYTGLWKKSVVTGISGKRLIIRKSIVSRQNVNDQKKNRRIEKFGGGRNFPEKLYDILPKENTTKENTLTKFDKVNP